MPQDVSPAGRGVPGATSLETSPGAGPGPEGGPDRLREEILGAAGEAARRLAPALPEDLPVLLRHLFGALPTAELAAESPEALAAAAISLWSLASERKPAEAKLRLQPLSGDAPAQEVDMPAVLQSVSTELLLRAAVDGTGVAITSRLLAEEHLARGELVHVLPEWIFSRYTIYAALPSGRMLPARTKVFLDFLTRQVPRAMAEKAGR